MSFLIGQVDITTDGMHTHLTLRYVLTLVVFGYCRMKEYGVHPDDKVICFGQLLGMCDQVSFPLGMYTRAHVRVEGRGQRLFHIICMQVNQS